MPEVQERVSHGDVIHLAPSSGQSKVPFDLVRKVPEEDLLLQTFPSFLNKNVFFYFPKSLNPMNETLCTQTEDIPL